MHYGIDVSSNNAHPINWAAAFAYLAQLGGGATPFVIVKINEGTGYINPDANGDIAAARAAGFIVGGYLMDHGSSNVGSEEALYRQVAGGLPQFDDDELPDGLSTAQYITHLNGLIAQQAAPQYLNQSEVQAGYNQSIGLWLAEYNNQPGNTIVSAWIHQYNNVGTIPGCGGQFDMNVWCGSEAQFDVTFNLAPPTQPTTTPENTMLGVAPLVTTPDGVQHTAQIAYPGVLLHVWITSDGVAHHENVAQIAASDAGLAANSPIASLTFDGNQVPDVQILGNQLVLEAQTAVGGTSFEFVQTEGTSTWGVRELV